MQVPRLLGISVHFCRQKYDGSLDASKKNFVFLLFFKGNLENALFRNLIFLHDNNKTVFYIITNVFVDCLMYSCLRCLETRYIDTNPKNSNGVSSEQ